MTEILNKYGLPIKWDAKTHTMTCGELIRNNFQMFKRGDLGASTFRELSLGKKKPKYHLQFALAVLGKEYYAGSNDPRSKGRMLTELLGNTPTRHMRTWNAVMYDKWCAGYEWLWYAVAWHHHQGYLSNVITQGRFNAELIAMCQEVHDDGLDHLLPFVFYWEKSPQQLKTELRPAVWKAIAKNSLYRNRMLQKASRTMGPLEDIFQLSSSFLKGKGDEFSVTSLDRETIAKLACTVDRLGRERKVLSKKEEIKKILHTLNDTRRMADRLGRPFDFKWSWRRIKEAHERYVHETMRQKFSPEPFPMVQELPQELLRVNFDSDWSAVLITSPLDLAKEGEAQHHCVGSYVDSCKAGSYRVYSIQHQGERYSTLSFHKRLVYIVNEDSPKTPKWEISQHYKACNTMVDREEAKQLANQLAVLQNEEYVRLTGNAAA